jgi:hypothetical protein
MLDRVNGDDGFRASEVSRALNEALANLRKSENELARLQAIRNGAEELTRLGDDGSDPIGDLSNVAIDIYGLSPDLVQDLIAGGIEQGTVPKAPSIVPDPPATTNGKTRSNVYPQKPGSADIALKPDASKAILRLDEWLKRDLEPPTLVMGEWLSTTSRVMMYAPTGLGKSMFGIGLGMRTAAGNGFLHWQGHRPYRVLYIDGEMSRALLKERLAGEAERLGHLPATFYALSHEDVENFAPLNTEEGQKTIDAIIEKIGGIDLLLLDNIMCLVSGDMKEEESWRQTVPWQHSLTKRRIGQFWFHHTGHDESKGYGTKTKEWQLDTVLKMEKVERENTDVALAFTSRRPDFGRRKPGGTFGTSSSR